MATRSESDGGVPLPVLTITYNEEAWLPDLLDLVVAEFVAASASTDRAVDIRPVDGVKVVQQRRFTLFRISGITLGTRYSPRRHARRSSIKQQLDPDPPRDNPSL